jgi:hypothetical protein
MTECESGRKAPDGVAIANAYLRGLDAMEGRVAAICAKASLLGT